MSHRWEELFDVEKQRVVRSFLLTLLVLLALFCAVELALRPQRLLRTVPLLSVGTAVVVVGTALRLNRKGFSDVAVSIAAGLLTVSASVPLLAFGLRGNEPVLLVFFVPLVVAALVLDRTALRLTSFIALAAAAAAPALHGERLFGTFDDPGAWSLVGPFVLVLLGTTYLLDRFDLRLMAAMRRAVAVQVQARSELVEEKGFTDAIVEGLPGLFFVRADDGSFVRWNRRFREVIGYEDEEIAALRPLDIFEEASREVAAASIARVLSEGAAAADVELRTKEGRVLHYFFSGTRVERQGRRYIAVTGIDRTDIDTAHADIEGLNVALHDRVARLTALREIDRAIVGSLDIGLTLKVMLEQVTDRLGVPAARVLLFDEPRNELRVAARHGLDAGRYLVVPVGVGPGGVAARDRRRVMVSGVEEVAAVPGVPAERGFAAYAALPLVAKGKLQGVLEVFSDQPFPEGEDWHDFLDALATQAAIGLSNARMLDELERSNLELRLAYDTTIEGWARALDLKDGETEGHSRRVADLAVRLAARLGMRGDELVHVRRGALLHDIGKMGVPDSVLLKAGPLDPQEWEVMKSHTTLAFEMLSGVPFLRPALDIPYAHHERWDGSGYPRGLKGEEIPLAARLFAVVDVYDAITSDRPYRSAWTEEQALDHIASEAGKRFDPRVVEAFLGMIAQIGGGRRVPAGTVRRSDDQR